MSEKDLASSRLPSDRGVAYAESIDAWTSGWAKIFSRPATATVRQSILEKLLILQEEIPNLVIYIPIS